MKNNYIKEYCIKNNKNIILIIEKDINKKMYNELYNILNKLLENGAKNILYQMPYI